LAIIIWRGVIDRHKLPRPQRTLAIKSGRSRCIDALPLLQCFIVLGPHMLVNQAQKIERGDLVRQALHRMI
jgi:hypothetical protein